LHTASLGESLIDNLISDLETLLNPTVGLSAHSGQVDIRITAKAKTNEEAENLIAPVEDTIRQRLGDSIYGIDDETLEGAAIDHLTEKQWSLAVCEYGSNGELMARLARFGEPFRGGEILPNEPEPGARLPYTAQLRQKKAVEIALGVFIHPGDERQEIFITLVTPEGSQEILRPYGGPPGNAPRFAANNSLDILRKL
jgi:nicotinamide-nucleotide amidase